MHIYFRISDKGNPKQKIAHADKFSCIKNAITEFGSIDFHVIADNCNPETVLFVKSLGLDCEETALGNSASFMYMLGRILRERKDSDTVYVLEDDYLHLPGSAEALSEGLEIGDYVTLYDHPDKYKTESNGGNPLNRKTIHTTRLYATKSSHWRETDSTTMTFACAVKILREDYDVWKKYTTERNPDDFHAFMTLTQKTFSDVISFLVRRRKREVKILFKNWLLRKKTRILISAIPAKATHAELQWLAPVIDWNLFFEKEGL